jgi:hypothetical protein
MPNALKYPNPKPAAGGGANAGAGKAAWENARTRPTRTAWGGGCATGTAADRLARAE